jgi:DNA transformation protein
MDRDFLTDLFSEFGPVSLRRMFSGYGISADGTNFALVLRGAIYFRADEQTVPRFQDEGSKPFQYDTRGKVVTVGSYWQLPDRLYDDPEELAQWARAALAAAERAAAAKRSKSSRSKAKTKAAPVKKTRKVVTPRPTKTSAGKRPSTKEKS